MDSTFALSLNPKIKFDNGTLLYSCFSHRSRVLFGRALTSFHTEKRSLRVRQWGTRAASAAVGGSARPPQGRRVYRQSQGTAASPRLPVKDIVSNVAPVGLFLAATIGLSLFQLLFY